MKQSIVWDKEFVRVTVGETASFAEINGLNGRLIGDYRFDIVKFQLWDFSYTQKMILREKKDMKIFAELDKVATRWNPDLKVAIVAQEEQVVKELQNYVDSMEETDWETQIFNTVEKAMEWARA